MDEICQCGFSRNTFHNVDTTAAFQCFDNSPTAVTFHGEIVAANSSQVISYMEQWVATNPTIVIQSSRLSVDSSCNVEIDSFNDPECGTIISTMNDDSVNTGAIIGVVGGVLATLILAVSLAVVVVLLVKARRKKVFNNVDNDGCDIYLSGHTVHD